MATQTKVKTGAAHTPGPWYVTEAAEDLGYCRIREEASDYVVATADDGGHVDPQFAFPLETIEANARLIAAAPELYEALTQARQALAHEAIVTYQPGTGLTLLMSETLRVVEAALAKIDGAA